MGGELSAVTPTTKNVLLFVQTYEPKHIRKTSLATQTRTIAAQLFEKQPDPELVLPVLIKGVELILKRGGGTISSSILDLYHQKPTSKSIVVDVNWLNTFIGVTIDIPQIINILSRLGFEVKKTTSSTLKCAVPSWRLHDIQAKEDCQTTRKRTYKTCW